MSMSVLKNSYNIRFRTDGYIETFVQYTVQRAR